MLIQPDTYIRLIKNCPLDKTYDHTIYFANEEKQIQYFKNTLQGIPFSKQSYQRYDKGVLHIQSKAEDLYDCNYLMFQNTAFGNKYFYAFITSIEYVNNVSSRVTYEIDVMQTWFFDYNLCECFIEREHSSTDEMFANLVPENLDLGDDYINNKTDVFDMNNMAVCILASIDTNKYQPSGRTVNNIYTPLNIIAGVPSNDPASVDVLVNEYIAEGQEDRIVAIYQYPEFLGDASTSTAVTSAKNITPNLTTIDGYTPKNKKLFTHPYNFLLVSNNAGNTAEFKWENWKDSTKRGNFKVTGVFVSTPSVMCYPISYRGITEDYDSGLTLNSFPQCPWVGDAFKAWWAQNKASVATSVGSSVLAAGLAVGAFALNPALGAATEGAQFMAGVGALGAVAGAERNVASTLAKVKDLKNTPPQVHGQAQTDSLNAGMGRVEYSFYSMSIKSQFAKIIDDYFDRYGYATHLNKIPNRNVRPHWTFTKTKGCTITGSIPADDAVAITKIYDNGITFWKSGSEVGDYSLDNKPT